MNRGVRHTLFVVSVVLLLVGSAALTTAAVPTCKDRCNSEAHCESGCYNTCQDGGPTCVNDGCFWSAECGLPQGAICYCIDIGV